MASISTSDLNSAARGPDVPSDVRLMRVTANLLLVLALVTWVVIGINWAARRPAFALHSIRIEGDVSRNSASTIRVNAAPKLAGNFFTTDLQATKRAFEAVPWVRQAIVRREWPGRLLVRLEEHQAVAVWNGESTSDKLVNSHGEVFEANIGDVEDDSLPTLNGPEGSSAAMLAMLARLQPVFAKLDTQVDSLNLSGRGSWHAELDNGAVVELGRGNEDEVIARAERFVGTLEQVSSRYEQRPLEYADLRHNDGYALRLKGITTLEPASAPLAGLPKPAPKPKPQKKD